MRAARSTHTVTISQEPFCLEIYRKNAGPQFQGARFVRACAVETHMDISQEPFCVEIYKKTPDHNPRHGILCETHMDISQEPFFAAIYREKIPRTIPPTSIEHRALTLTVRTP